MTQPDVRDYSDLESKARAAMDISLKESAFRAYALAVADPSVILHLIEENKGLKDAIADLQYEYGSTSKYTIGGAMQAKIGRAEARAERLEKALRRFVGVMEVWRRVSDSVVGPIDLRKAEYEARAALAEEEQK